MREFSKVLPHHGYDQYWIGSGKDGSCMGPAPSASRKGLNYAYINTLHLLTSRTETLYLPLLQKQFPFILVGNGTQTYRTL